MLVSDKLNEIRKKVKIQNCLLQKDLQIRMAKFFMTCIFFFPIKKNSIKNRKFNFLTRICKIRKKCAP